MNNQSSSLSRYILVVLCIAVAFTALILVILNSWARNNVLSFLNRSTATYDDGYRAGFLAARQKYLGLPTTSQGAPIVSVHGKVQEISGQSIKLVADNADTDQIVDGISNVRTAIISASTTIVMRTPLPIDKINALNEQWRRDSQRNSLLPPPSPFTDTPISLSAIKTGDVVSVIAGENIRLKESFTARQVILVKATPLPTVK